MRKLILLSMLAGLASAPPLNARDLDWNTLSDRTDMDAMMRGLALNCANFGFVQNTESDPDETSKKMYTWLLLKPKISADTTFSQWGRYYQSMVGIGNEESVTFKETVDEAGAAMTAAAMDPTAHEQAKAKYIRTLKMHMAEPYANCTYAARDEFLSVNYLSGSGSWKKLETEWGAEFDREVEGLKAWKKSEGIID